MEILTIIYLFFIFVSLYLTLLFLILFIKNREKFFQKPASKLLPTISLLIPAYNAEKRLEPTLKNLENLDYPKNKLEFIVIDDGSKDKTAEVARKFKWVRLLRKPNGGKASAVNVGVSRAKGELIGVIDDDSFPEPRSLRKMVPFFNEKQVAAVTSCILIKKPKKLLEWLQAIEYAIIIWSRKLMEYIDSIFVTPGALALYKRNAIIEVGGFDEKNITEDIEIAFRLLEAGYLVRLSTDATVHTIPPNTMKSWWRQRLRWDIGGLQTLNKYKHHMFKPSKKMFGLFVIPFWTLFFTLSLVGFGVLSYVTANKVLTYFTYSKYSYITGSTVLSLSQLNLTPTVFTFFGIVLVGLMLSFAILGIRTINKVQPASERIRILHPNIFIYTFIYVCLFPIVLIHSLIKIAQGYRKW